MKRSAGNGCGRWRIFWFATVLHVLVWRQALGQDSVAWKFESYEEDDGRMKVLAHYFEAKLSLGERSQLKLVGLTDALSGASPSGLLPRNPADPLPFTQLPDERRNAGVANFEYRFGVFTGGVEASYSEEPDYESLGGAINGRWELNGKNTTLRAGGSYLRDRVLSSPVDDLKEVYDVLVGVTQVVNRNTLFTFNLGYGLSEGYLGDPYKLIGQTQTVVLPGLPPIVRIQGWKENRPDERNRWVALASVNRNFESLRAAVEASYRAFDDDWGIRSHTFSLNWLQRVGGHLVIEPILRYYRQSAADFYLISLDGTGINPIDGSPSGLPTGKAPYYSADYRLSELEAVTTGIKLIWFPNDRFTIDVAYERYEMRGRDGQTRDEAYPSANIITLGAKYAF